MTATHSLTSLVHSLYQEAGSERLTTGKLTLLLFPIPCLCVTNSLPLGSPLSTRDTYWILRGLLLCEMTETARGMIENMAYLIQQ